MAKRDLIKIIEACQYENTLLNFLNQEYTHISNEFSIDNEKKQTETIEDKQYFENNNEVFRDIKNLFSNLFTLIYTKDMKIMSKEVNEQNKIDKFANINPIDFVQTYETEYKQFEKNPPSSLSLIKQYLTTNKNHMRRFQIEKNSPLYQEIPKPLNKINVIKAIDSSIFVGCSNSRIWEYKEDLSEKSKLYHNVTNNNKGGVTAMDISSDCLYLIAGYQIGNIILWDCITQKEIKLIDEEFVSSDFSKQQGIISIKYLKNSSEKIHHFISSNALGEIKKYQVVEGKISANAEVSVLFQGNHPFYLMTPLIITENERKKYTEFKHIKNTVIVIGNPDMTKLLFIDIDNDENCYSKDLLTKSAIKSLEFQDAFFKITSLPHKREKEILLFLSNSTAIYIYSIIGNHQYLQEYYKEGSYYLKQKIYKLVLVHSSNLYFIDNNNTMNALNIKGFKNSFFNSFGDDLQDNNSLKEELLISDKITTYIDKQQTIPNHNIITIRKRDIFILGENNLNQLSFKNRKIIMYDYLKQNNIIAFLSYGLRYYNRKEKKQIGVEKKKEIIDSINKALNQYLISLVNNKKLDNINKYDFCYMVIEFFCEVKSDSYILNYIDKAFSSFQNKKTFLSIFEQFILCNKCKMISSFSSQDTLKLFNEFYNLRASAIPQILCYLNLNEIVSNPIYKEKCREKKLITPIIIIGMNSANPDYFSLIDYVYQLFQNAEEIPWDKFISYSYCYANTSLNLLENSKQYIGHKLFWLIDMCIRGYKYPKNDPISDDDYHILIPTLFYWIVTSDIIATLIKFDSSSCFQLLTHLFIEDKAYKTLYEINQESNLPMLTVVNLIIEATQNSNFYVIQDLNEFLVTIGSKIDFPRQMKIDIITALFNYYSELDNPNKDEAIEDRFQCHSDLLISNSRHINDLSNKMIEMINSITDLNEKECTDFIEASEKSLYLLVKVHLLQMNENYLTCLNLYLKCDIKEKDKKLFEFIDEVLEKLNDKSEDSNAKKILESFEKGILESVKELAELSYEKLVSLTNKWFLHDRETVIQKLNECPLLQLKYIETLINLNYKSDNQMNFIDEQDNNNSDSQTNNHLYIDSNELSDLFLKQIELYIKLGKKKMVLKLLKESTDYPQNECLDLCKKYNINEACIYLHQQMGNHNSALQVSLNDIIQSFVSIEKNLSKGIENDRHLEMLLDELKRNIYQSEDICEACTDEEALSKDYDDLWLTLVNELYSRLNRFKNESVTASGEKVCKCLSDQIEKILKKMCCFVSIDKIIQSVTANCRNATFKEFNTLLNKLLFSFGNMKKLLYSAQNLLSHSISYSVNHFQRLNIRGTNYQLNKCDACHASLIKKDDERIFCFKCGHITHLSCTISIRGEKRCKLCGEDELNDTKPKIMYNTINDQIKESIVSIAKINNNDIQDKIFEKKREERKLKTLKAIDKDLNEKFTYFK